MKSPCLHSFFQMVRIVFQYDMWHKRGGAYELPVFKKECLYYNVGNNFVLVSELEILFPSINESINYKTFLRLLRLPPGLLAILQYIYKTNRTCQQTRSRFAWILYICNRYYFPNHWLMQLFFLPLQEGPDLQMSFDFEQHNYQNPIQKKVCALYVAKMFLP